MSLWWNAIIWISSYIKLPCFNSMRGDYTAWPLISYTPAGGKACQLGCPKIVLNHLCVYKCVDNAKVHVLEVHELEMY